MDTALCLLYKSAQMGRLSASDANQCCRQVQCHCLRFVVLWIQWIIDHDIENDGGRDTIGCQYCQTSSHYCRWSLGFLEKPCHLSKPLVVLLVLEVSFCIPWQISCLEVPSKNLLLLLLAVSAAVLVEKSEEETTCTNCSTYIWGYNMIHDT